MEFDENCQQGHLMFYTFYNNNNYYLPLECKCGIVEYWNNVEVHNKQQGPHKNNQGE